MLFISIFYIITLCDYWFHSVLWLDIEHFGVKNQMFSGSSSYSDHSICGLRTDDPSGSENIWLTFFTFFLQFIYYTMTCTDYYYIRISSISTSVVINSFPHSLKLFYLFSVTSWRTIRSWLLAETCPPTQRWASPSKCLPHTVSVSLASLRTSDE